MFQLLLVERFLAWQIRNGRTVTRLLNGQCPFGIDRGKLLETVLRLLTQLSARDRSQKELELWIGWWVEFVQPTLLMHAMLESETTAICAVHRSDSANRRPRDTEANCLSVLSKEALFVLKNFKLKLPSKFCL